VSYRMPTIVNIVMPPPETLRQKIAALSGIHLTPEGLARVEHVLEFAKLSDDRHEPGVRSALDYLGGIVAAARAHRVAQEFERDQAARLSYAAQRPPLRPWMRPRRPRP
jgi:hypothetical protein